MSVENSNVIDFMSISPDNEAVLTISDHLDWNEEYDHLAMLQDKINTYLEAIGSGEIYESYPAAIGKMIKIQIAFKYSPMQTTIEFLTKVKELIEQSGYGFYYYELPGDK